MQMYISCIAHELTVLLCPPQAFRFENTAKRLKNNLFWKRVRFYSATVLGALIILYIVTAVACGPTYSSCT